MPATHEILWKRQPDYGEAQANRSNATWGSRSLPWGHRYPEHTQTLANLTSRITTVGRGRRRRLMAGRTASGSSAIGPRRRPRGVPVAGGHWTEDGVGIARRQT